MDNFIYISNLNERVKKDEMKHRLYMLLSGCGNISKYVIKRGYAFIEFESPESREKALKFNDYFFIRKTIKVLPVRPKITKTILIRASQDIINMIAKKCRVKIRNVPSRNLTFIDFNNLEDSKKEYDRLRNKNVDVRFV